MRRLLGRIAGPEIDLVVEVEPGLPAVGLSHGAFRLVVVELVRSASAAIVARGRIAVRASAASECVLLTIADSGPGRDGDELPGALGPFHAMRTRGASADTGLAAVHDVLAANNAVVEVAATPGGGSKFSIYLPLAT